METPTSRQIDLGRPRNVRINKSLALCLTAAVGMILAIFCRRIKNSLLQTKSTEIWVNSHTVPHYACINLRSFSTP